MADQVLKVLQQPPFEIYELLTVAQGVLQVSAIDAGTGEQPLTTALFVDPATVLPTAEQNGSAAAPFKTIAQAIAALPARDGGTVLCCPGTYPAEALDGSGKSVTLQGLAGSQRDTGRVAAAVDLTSCTLQSSDPVALVNVQIGAVDTTIVPASPQAVVVSGCNLDGTLTCDSARISDSLTSNIVASGPVFLSAVQVQGTLVCAGEPTWIDSSVSGDITCEDLTCTNCTLQGTVTNATVFDPLVFNNCALTRILSVAPVTLIDSSVGNTSTHTATSLTAHGCSSISGDWTVTGDVNASDSVFHGLLTCNRVQRAKDSVFEAQIDITQAGVSSMIGCQLSALNGVGAASVEWDSYSASWVVPTGGMTNSLVAPFADLVVNVPVLGANAIGSVAVSTVGTQLEGLSTSDRVCTQEPAAGVAGGGFLASWFIDAANSITFKFHGVTTGGNQTFRVVRI